MTSPFNIFRNTTSAPTGARGSALVAAVSMGGSATARGQSVATTGVFVTGPTADDNFNALARRGAG